MSTPLFQEQDPTTEVLEYAIGIGLVWVWFATVIYGMGKFMGSPLGWGTAAAWTFIGTFVGVGGHELAHRVFASEHCQYDEVHFDAFVQTALWTLGSIAFALLLALLDVFNVVTVSRWLYIIGLASPGAVVAKGTARVPRCMDDIAIVGPAWNLFVTVVTFLLLNGQLAGLTGTTELVLFYAFLINLTLALTNIIPVGMLDGKKVVEQKQPVTMFLWGVVFFGALWFLQFMIP